MRKKRFRDMSPAGRLFVCALTAVGVLIVASAEHDIQRRSADQVAGGKLPWRLVSLNALGALAYFRWGRRQA